jgi:hypothetical protein
MEVQCREMSTHTEAEPCLFHHLPHQTAFAGAFGSGRRGGGVEIGVEREAFDLATLTCFARKKTTLLVDQRVNDIAFYQCNL